MEFSIITGALREFAEGWPGPQTLELIQGRLIEVLVQHELTAAEKEILADLFKQARRRIYG